MTRSRGIDGVGLSKKNKKWKIKFILLSLSGAAPRGRSWSQKVKTREQDPASVGSPSRLK